MDATTLLGYFAGFLTTAAFVPQVWKTWKSKSATDLSLAMFSVFSVGVFCWLVYGIMIAQIPIIFWNVITLVLALALLAMKLKYD
ncbi:MAG: SemiSWEET transporter [Nitrospina sp.]|jgi:MtN3 and saliva related transmembrane protein|nr:SemiSWEET transporter [Nitrospina sp.]